VRQRAWLVQLHVGGSVISVIGTSDPRLFFVVADSTDLVSDLRVESVLLKGLVRAGSRPPIGRLFYALASSSVPYWAAGAEMATTRTRAAA
jgi:hypothetical protein